MRIPIFTEIYEYFIIFKKHAKSYLGILLLVVIIGGFFESIGIAMLMPLLDQASVSSSSHNPITRTVSDLFSKFRIPFTFVSIIFTIILIFLIKMIVLIIQESIKSNISAKLQYQLRTKVVTLYSKLNYQFYTDSSIGYLNNLVTTEIGRAVSAFNNYTNMVSAFIYVIFYLTISCFINFEVATYGAIIGFLILFSLRFISTFSRRFSIRTSEKNASIQSLLIQIIDSFQYLKSTNTFGNLLLKLNDENQEFASLEFKTRMLSGILRSLQETLSIIAVCILLYYMVSIKGNALNEILVIAVLFQRTINRVGQFQGAWQKFNVHVGGIDTLDHAFGELSNEIEIVGTEIKKEFKSEISLKNVTFEYGNISILNNVNLKILQNSMIAITGESGSGKTTLINLITGLLKPTKGEISIDGKNYNEIDINSLRSMIGYVTQESVVFNDTLSNNITLWKPAQNSHEKENLSRACNTAYLFDDSGYFRAGFDTILGDKGVKLSGGQKQRVGIARELFREPAILILDEATSALDSKTEKVIQKSIDQLKGELTIVIISHRLSTVQNCDLIYVLKNGQLCESGTFNELSNNEESEFFKMVSLQSFSN